MTRKLIIYDGRHEREVALVGTLIVGRDPSCHISDLDPLLSRRHAEFVSTAKGVTLRDLGSRNGMLVNGDKVTERRLVEGDVVQLGHLQFRFVEEKNELTPDEQSRANATTAQAFDHSTITTPPPGPLAAEIAEAAREPRAITHGDGDHTRVSMPPGAEPTFVRPAADPDATFAAPPPGLPGDDVETFAGRAAEAPFDPDGETPMPSVVPGDEETFAAPASSVDHGDKPSAPPVSADSETMAGYHRRDLDATIGGNLNGPADGAGNDDRTFVVTPIRRSDLFPEPAAAVESAVSADNADRSVDPDATLGPGDMRTEDLGLGGLFTPVPVAAAPTGQPARVVAGMDRRIRTASVACGQLLGTAPDRLIGLTLEELFARSVDLVEKEDGPAALSFTLERSSSDQTLTLIITAGQATEPVS